MRTLRPLGEYQVAGRGMISFLPPEPVKPGEVIAFLFSDTYARIMTILDVDGDGVASGRLECRESGHGRRNLFARNFVADRLPSTRLSPRKLKLHGGSSWRKFIR